VKVSLVILGEPASKANSRELVTFGRGEDARPAMIKSKKARDYERDALLQIPPAARAMLEGPVRVTLRIYYASERPDLDESVVLDVLQARFAKRLGTRPREVERTGVYVNDRQVREKHVYHAIDRANPRAEIEVEELVPAPAALFDELPIPIAKPRRKEERVLERPSLADVAPGADPF
jgi:Holliday junction resolvase RusA-like endonuclease